MNIKVALSFVVLSFFSLNSVAEYSEQQQQQIIQAIEDRDYSLLDQLVVDGFTDDLRIDYYPVAQYAIEEAKDAELLRYVIGKSNFSDHKLATHFAIYAAGQPELQKVIISSGLTATSKYSKDPLLHDLVGDIEGTKLLLGLGADLNELNSEGEPLLFRAASLPASERVPYLAFLREQNYDFQQTSVDGRKLIHSAAQNGDVSLVRELIAQGFKLEDKDAAGVSAKAYLVATNEGAQHAPTFFEPGTLTNDEVQFALNRAIRKGNEVAVHYLLKNFPDTPIDSDGFAQALRNKTPVANLLLAAGANPLEVDQYGRNGLYLALGDENYDVIATMVAAGVQLPKGFLLDPYQVGEINAQTLSLLSALGVNPETQVGDDYTLGDYLKENEDEELYRIVSDKQSARSTVLSAVSPNCGKDSPSGSYVGIWKNQESDDVFNFKADGSFEFKQEILFNTLNMSGRWAATNCGVEIVHDGRNDVLYYPVLMQSQSEMRIQLPLGNALLKRI